MFYTKRCSIKEDGAWYLLAPLKITFWQWLRQLFGESPHTFHREHLAKMNYTIGKQLEWKEISPNREL